MEDVGDTETKGVVQEMSLQRGSEEKESIRRGKQRRATEKRKFTVLVSLERLMEASWSLITLIFEI